MKRWVWDARRRIYIDTHGVRLTNRELREALDEYIDSIQQDFARKVAAYTANRMSFSTLFSELNEEVSLLHKASGAIAYGGLEQMDLEKWARIESELLPELGYLAEFKQDVQAAASIGELSAEGIANRAGLYAEAAYSEYVIQTVEREADNGVTLGRRICENDGASCDECVDAATEEFIPLDEIADIGSLQCINNCRCEIEFLVDGTEFRPSEIFRGIVGGQDRFGGSVEIN